MIEGRPGIATAKSIADAGAFLNHRILSDTPNYVLQFCRINIAYIISLVLPILEAG